MSVAPARYMTGRQADRLAAGAATIATSLVTAAITWKWEALAPAAPALGYVLKVLAEVYLAGGESGEEPDPAPAPKQGTIT